MAAAALSGPSFHLTSNSPGAHLLVILGTVRRVWSNLAAIPLGAALSRTGSAHSGTRRTIRVGNRMDLMFVMMKERFVFVMVVGEAPGSSESTLAAQGPRSGS